MQKKFKFIVGLGNPGVRYRNTYHNAGFLFVDFLIAHLKQDNRKKISTRSAFSKIKNFRVYARNGIIIVKPLVSMNESGRAVKAALSYFRTSPQELLVAHDDADILLGKWKFSRSRGSAGHRGVESIINGLHTKNFSRLRIGVRAKKGKAETFVLSRILPAHRAELYSAFEGAMEKVIENESPL